MVELRLIPRDEFRRVEKSALPEHDKLALIGDMCRANALVMVKKAGSGHLGSSFSSLDLVVYLYFKEMNLLGCGIEDPARDIYFSSKGHDVPGQYAVLYALGLIPKEKTLLLRRLGGLDGHPDVAIPGIEANSGSLGMGISKARGMAAAKTLKVRGGRVFVMLGDGELQEGQIYEALQTTAQQGVSNIMAIVDHNKVQSDKSVREIVDLRDLQEKVRSFGWAVERCDGHDFAQIEGAVARLSAVKDRPKFLIADTIKGRGVSFMEHPRALKEGGGLYRWHAGAPDDEAFRRAHQELLARVDRALGLQGEASLRLEPMPLEEKPSARVSQEYVAEAFGEALAEIGGKRGDLVVLDADLAADCRLRRFEARYPDRFIENGIAEQDMVSMAGGLALQGLLPVVNSFAAFLASRANEQIYTNACEGTRIIYVCHYAGLIPAGPGKSHQSIRDISLLRVLPNIEILQPCNGVETRMTVDYMVNASRENCVLRLAIGPSPRIIELPAGYRLTPGRGAVLREGDQAVLIGYGPVMLHEALLASEMLEKKGFSLKVINLPWLNKVDLDWLSQTIGQCPAVYILEDHSPVGGLGDSLIRQMAEQDRVGARRFRVLGVEGYPACGTPAEALGFHRLDGSGLAERILEDCHAGGQTRKVERK